MTSPNELYSVSAKVRPSPLHPAFYEWQFGILQAWLYATSPDDAAKKLQQILPALPYEQLGSEVLVRLDLPEPKSSAPRKYDNERAQAKALGIGFGLHRVDVGADEGDFENWDFS